MDEEFKKQLVEAVKQQVKETVNGKIDALHKKIDPVVEFYENLTFTTNAIQWILKFIALAGVAVGTIWAAIKFLK